MENIKISLLNFIKTDIDRAITVEKQGQLPTNFSWEILFKSVLFSRSLKIISDRILELSKVDITKEEKEELLNIGNILSNKSELLEIEDQISFIKDEMIKSGVLKVVHYKDRENEISQFFKTKTGFDFNGLEKEEQLQLLNKEDILVSNDNIYDYLNISHLQYKYLYQTGSFLTSK